jgi:hypothetical protein
LLGPRWPRTIRSAPPRGGASSDSAGLRIHARTDDPRRHGDRHPGRRGCTERPCCRGQKLPAQRLSRRDDRADVPGRRGDRALSVVRSRLARSTTSSATKPIEFGDLEATVEHLSMLRRLRDEKLAAERAAGASSRYFSPNIVETLSRQPDRLTPHGARRRSCSPTWRISRAWPKRCRPKDWSRC